ncbi:hypothetical protein C8R43DRAFT_1109623 [Mycena crocata]|nr:hypothetical protein C8R43DRAFT_1109623 [Mycena crocata]
MEMDGDRHSNLCILMRRGDVLFENSGVFRYTSTQPSHAGMLLLLLGGGGRATIYAAVVFGVSIGLKNDSSRIRSDSCNSPRITLASGPTVVTAQDAKHPKFTLGGGTRESTSSRISTPGRRTRLRGVGLPPTIAVLSRSITFKLRPHRRLRSILVPPAAEYPSALTKLVMLSLLLSAAGESLKCRAY